VNEPSVDLYGHVYADFESAAETAVRREAYGDDIGQSSWLTAREWLDFADSLEIGAGSDVLEVGSGSGGPAVYLAEKRGCRITGVDINEHGVRNAAALAASRGLADRARFEVVDAARPLPFQAGRFSAVVSNDAMCHIRDRLAVLRDWHRVLAPGGRALFTDAMVVTGAVSHEELATRSSIGFYLFVPPGENERMLAEAGLVLREARDVTANAEQVARRWHDARERQREVLERREGSPNFEGLQRFLMCVHTLSAERRLSRFAYLAEKPTG
jgi:SAM-dependent methyltransferase